MQDDPLLNNWRKIEYEQVQLFDWRLKVLSSLLVASSAVLVLSIGQVLSGSSTIHTSWLHYVATIVNGCQILTTIVAIYILSKCRIERVRTLEKAVSASMYRTQAELYPYDAPENSLLYRTCELSAFALFAALTVILICCGLIA